LPDRVLLGAVIGAHGVRGEVKVKSFTEFPEDLHAYGDLMTENGRVVVIAQLRPTTGDEAIARFEGIDTREAAEALKGQGLYVLRSALPDPEPGEYYQHDLIGLKVEDPDGAALGKVSGLHNFGAGDMLEIESAAGEKSYVPFTDEFVPVVDVAAGRIVADLPRYESDQQ
jgi:16S rRNA processing protein RimM